MKRTHLNEKRPPARVRRAGLTAAETPTPDHPTDDDASPETLIPEDKPDPIDQQLRVADESEIGEGFGKDEAELAEEDPVGRSSQRQRPPPGSRGPARVHSRNRQQHT